MIDLDSPEWARLSHAYGSARDVPKMIRDLARKEEEGDAWDRIYGSLLHQSDVYPATFAAVPHLVLLAERRSSEEQLPFWIFVGAVAAYGPKQGRGIPEDIRREFLKAVERVVPPVYRAILAGPDEDSTMLLLQVLAALRGSDLAGRNLDCLTEGELQRACPGCDRDLFIEIVPEGIYIALTDPVVEGVEDRRWVAPALRNEGGSSAALESLHLVPCSKWLPELAERAGHPALADQIRGLYGRATCPGCGKEFGMMEEPIL